MDRHTSAALATWANMESVTVVIRHADSICSRSMFFKKH
jgi:hypothetical protein